MLPSFKSEPETISRSQLYKKYNSYLNVLTILIIVLLVPYYFIQMTRYCVSEGTSFAGVELDNFNVYFFYILGTEFLIVGLLMLVQIRRYFPGFYKDYGCYLVAATLFLALPMIFRALDNQIYRRYKRYFNY